MLQRIQTIYFLIAVLLVGALFFVPYAEIVTATGEIYWFDSKGFYLGAFSGDKMLFGNLSFIILNVICIILLFISIFQYKHRSRQLLYSRINIFILLTILVINSFNLWKGINLIPGNYQTKVFFIFPLIAIVLIYMAIKAIKKDEKLLKSSNRIR